MATPTYFACEEFIFGIFEPKNNLKSVKIDVKILENRQNHVLRFAIEIDVSIRFRTWFYVFWKLDKIC